MKALMNAIAGRAMQATAGDTGMRQGIITAYDPDAYAVKVQLQPTGEETGWIPLQSPWAGNGWGLVTGPVIGAVVVIEPDSFNIGNGVAAGQLFNDVDRPPAVPSGEFWLVHQSGSLLKFTNDGQVLVSSAKKITYTAPAHHFSGGDVTVDENLIVVKDIYDQNQSVGSVNTLRTTYNGHTHHENGQGSNTSSPNQQVN